MTSIILSGLFGLVVWALKVLEQRKQPDLPRPSEDPNRAVAAIAHLIAGPCAVAAHSVSWLTWVVWVVMGTLVLSACIETVKLIVWHANPQAMAEYYRKLEEPADESGSTEKAASPSEQLLAEIQHLSPYSLAGTIGKTVTYAMMAAIIVTSISAMAYGMVLLPQAVFEAVFDQTISAQLTELGYDPAIGLNILHWLGRIVVICAALGAALRVTSSRGMLSAIAIWRKLSPAGVQRFEDLAKMYPELNEHRQRALAGRGFLTNQDLRVAETLQRIERERFRSGGPKTLSDVI